MGQPIPLIDYTSTETQTWISVYTQLREVHKLTMSNFFQNQFKKF
jgi:hypothetical protein